jgi:hypothetical protein
MRTIAANVVRILLLAIGVFTLGPQFGSIDIDGNGVPDVPAIVLHRSNNQNVEATRDGRPSRVVVAKASPLLALMCNDRGLIKARIVDESRGPMPESVLPLRC